MAVLSHTGMAQPDSSPVIVNLMIEVSTPSSPSQEDFAIAKDGLTNLYSKVYSKNATLFISKEIASSQAKLLVTRYVADNPGIELAMSGNYSDEKLEALSYLEQKTELANSKAMAESCRICPSELMVVGFKPPSFNQNEDTYKVLDELGIGYDAGFQVGILFTPGHQNNIWPYKVEGHKFYAVPVSTIESSGKKVPLDDRYVKDNGFSSSQWYDMLVNKFDEVSGKKEPLVISLSTSISGSGSFLSAYNQFVDYAISKGARFVATSELVNMSRAGTFELPAAPVSSSQIANVSINGSNASSSECKTCGEKQVDSETNIIGVNIGKNSSK